jgi:predicted transport protein
MENLKYTKPIRISLKENSELNEKWVQDRIAEDPSILGLGDLILKDKERAQPKAGRLDLLLQDAETSHRYEVEVQLGQTDETHIIRTIEYWDIERKRYPQYDHTAVIVAENITGRFLNVISLFNGFIPLIAVQMNAIKVGEHISLVCSTVLDEMTLGLVDEEEEVQEVTDRNYWIQRGTKETVNLVDDLFDLIKTVDDKLELKYNKFYIGLAKNEQTNNFVIFRPQKNSVRIEIRLPKSAEIEEKVNEIGLDVMDYDKKWGRYRIRLSHTEIKKHSIFLTDLFKKAGAGKIE